jgi:hypothetical protein
MSVCPILAKFQLHPHVKFHENLCCRSRVVLCGRTDRQTKNGVGAGNCSFSQLRETRLKSKSVQPASGLSSEPTTFRTARDSEGVQRAEGWGWGPADMKKLCLEQSGNGSVQRNIRQREFGTLCGSFCFWVIKWRKLHWTDRVAWMQ